MEVIVPQQAREVTQLLCLVHTVGKGFQEIQDYQVPLIEEKLDSNIYFLQVSLAERALLPVHFEPFCSN